MSNVVQSWPEISLPQEALLGLLTALSSRKVIAARVWPVTEACQSLAKIAEGIDPSVLSAARGASLPGGDTVVEDWLSGLAQRGVLRPLGRGISGCWAVDPSWLSGWRLAADAMAPAERHVWVRAAQTLDRCMSIWEKAAAAAASGSGASTSVEP